MSGCLTKNFFKITFLFNLLLSNGRSRTFSRPIKIYYQEQACLHLWRDNSYYKLLWKIKQISTKIFNSVYWIMWDRWYKDQYRLKNFIRETSSSNTLLLNLRWPKNIRSTNPLQNPCISTPAKCELWENITPCLLIILDKQIFYFCCRKFCPSSLRTTTIKELLHRELHVYEIKRYAFRGASKVQ